MKNFKIVTERTIAFPINNNQIWLSRKKKGQGVGNLNGFGGKIEKGETPESAAVREIAEENRIVVKPEDLIKRAEIYFHFPFREEWNQRTHVYFFREWQGEFQGTLEMEKAQPFDIRNIPYEKMWDSDRHWLPIILGGRRIKAYFLWKEDNRSVGDYSIDFLD